MRLRRRDCYGEYNLVWIFPALLNAAFRLLPFFQSSTWSKTDKESPVVGTSSRVDLSGGTKCHKRFLNVFSITHTDPPPATKASPVVMLHGFGAGKVLPGVETFQGLMKWQVLDSTSATTQQWLHGSLAQVSTASYPQPSQLTNSL